MVAAAKGVFRSFRKPSGEAPVLKESSSKKSSLAPDECWVIIEKKSNSVVVELICVDAFFLVVFSTKEKALQFLANRNIRDPEKLFILSLYQWDQLVASFGGQYEFATIDDTGFSWCMSFAVPLI